MANHSQGCPTGGCDYCVCAACHEPLPSRLLPLGTWLPDPCIGYLPGVHNACCGHGNDAEAYMTFGRPEGLDVRLCGAEALKAMRAMREALGEESNPRWHLHPS